MGLDMYLRARTNKREYKGPTGACSGMFPMAPEDNGMVEIGYWRKAYDQEQVIYEYTSGVFDETGHMQITKEEVDDIIAAANEILKTHKFDEKEGYDITEDSDFYYDTFNSDGKWRDTIIFFTEAKKILEEDPDAKIYYCHWA